MGWAGLTNGLSATPFWWANGSYINDSVVTRTMLYEHLFDENDSTLSNLLDVHVSNLRKKLGCELIATRRGQGYCIG
mgnify:CR=1 FL=1